MLYSFGNIYALDGNLGRAYNDHMKLLPNEKDWALFTDADIILWGDYGHQIQEIIDKEPNAGIITCLCNRIGNQNGHQLYKNQISDDPNIINHYRIHEKLSSENRGITRNLTTFISGMLMVVNRLAWDIVGGFPEDKGQVDNRFSYRVLHAGFHVLEMQGLYAFHYYRLHKYIKDKSHLPQMFFAK